MHLGPNTFMCWRRGKFAGPEEVRLAILKYAAVLGAPYVDVEYLAADYFFAGACPGPKYILRSVSLRLANLCSYSIPSQA